MPQHPAAKLSALSKPRRWAAASSRRPRARRPPCTHQGQLGKGWPEPSTFTAVRGRSVLRCSGRANHRDLVTSPRLPGGKTGSSPPPGGNFSSLTWRASLGALPNQPTAGRSSVSADQRETLDVILRQSAFPVGIDISEQRRLLRELVSAQPLPAEVTVTAVALGGVPTPRSPSTESSPATSVLPRRRVRAGGRLPGRRPVRPAAPWSSRPEPTRFSSTTPSASPGRPPPPTSRSPSTSPRRTARLPGLLPGPRRSGRGAGPSRTAPVSASRRGRTRHRIAKGRTLGMTDLRTNRGRLSSISD